MRASHHINPLQDTINPSESRLRDTLIGVALLLMVAFLLALGSVAWADQAGAVPPTEAPVATEPATRETAPAPAAAPAVAALPVVPASNGGWIPVTETVPSSAFNVAPPEIKSSGSTGWLVHCPYSHTNNDDPIVFPAQPGRSHTHDYMGSRIADAYWVPNATTKKAPTTCEYKLDSSSYWAPTLYEDGKAINPRNDVRTSKGVRARQKMYYRNPTYRKVTPMPYGLRMVAGNHAARSAAENAALGRYIYWGCSDNSTKPLAAPPTKCSTELMTAHIGFPNCWDGKHLDSPNHTAHMAYPSSGKCPSTHPVLIPRLIIRNEYLVGTSIGKITLATGANYTLHADFYNGWDPKEMTRLANDCMNAGKNCDTLVS